MVDLLERHLHLVLGAETGGLRYEVGAYGFWRAHVLALLREGNVEHRDQLVDALLAPLAPDVYRFQRQRGSSTQEISAALAWIAQHVLTR